MNYNNGNQQNPSSQYGYRVTNGQQHTVGNQQQQHVHQNANSYPPQNQFCYQPNNEQIFVVAQNGANPSMQGFYHMHATIQDDQNSFGVVSNFGNAISRSPVYIPQPHAYMDYENPSEGAPTFHELQNVRHLSSSDQGYDDRHIVPQSVSPHFNEFVERHLEDEEDEEDEEDDEFGDVFDNFFSGEEIEFGELPLGREALDEILRMDPDPNNVEDVEADNDMIEEDLQMLNLNPPTGPNLPIIDMEPLQNPEVDADLPAAEFDMEMDGNIGEVVSPPPAGAPEQQQSPAKPLKGRPRIYTKEQNKKRHNEQCKKHTQRKNAERVALGQEVVKLEKEHQELLQEFANLEIQWNRMVRDGRLNVEHQNAARKRFAEIKNKKHY